MALVTNWRKCTLTILSGQTESEELDLTQNGVRRVKSIQIAPPAALTGTVTVHVAQDTGGTYVPLANGGTNFTLPVSQAIQLSALVAGALKLVSSGAEGADRAFIVTGAAVKG